MHVQLGWGLLLLPRGRLASAGRLTGRTLTRLSSACAPARPRRTAPELLLENRCSEKIDIYSLGVLLW